MPNTVSAKEMISVAKPKRSLTDDDILQAFRRTGVVTRSGIEEYANISQAGASRIVRRLLNEGKITKIGNGKSSRYIIN